jgi:hypothetical protein
MTKPGFQECRGLEFPLEKSHLLQEITFEICPDAFALELDTLPDQPGKGTSRYDQQREP